MDVPERLAYLLPGNVDEIYSPGAKHSYSILSSAIESKLVKIEPKLEPLTLMTPSTKENDAGYTVSTGIS